MPAYTPMRGNASSVCLRVTLWLSDALHTVNIVTFKKNLQFCREKLLIHKLTSLSLPPSLYLGCACYRKDKRNSLKGGTRESQSYLWRDWFACLQAAIPIMPVLGECVSMRPSPLPLTPTHSQAPPLHFLLPPPLPPPAAPVPHPLPAPNLSIARFICVSHYRKWNVVPAKCINSEEGKLACCTVCSHQVI